MRAITSAQLRPLARPNHAGVAAHRPRAVASRRMVALRLADGAVVRSGT
jgi:hypothetical protein